MESIYDHQLFLGQNISSTVFCLFDRLTTLYSRAIHQESTGFILIDEWKTCQTKPNLSSGNDDDRQRTVRPADLWLECLETLDHGDGVGQGLTCRDQSQSSAEQIRNWGSCRDISVDWSISPEPVWERTTASRPDRRAGMVCFWTLNTHTHTHKTLTCALNLHVCHSWSPQSKSFPLWPACVGAHLVTVETFRTLFSVATWWRDTVQITLYFFLKGPSLSAGFEKEGRLFLQPFAKI